ncbi:MAG: hypothetical protein CMP47_07070 [Rickettsiales bacterium]|nr:hypothetical protein [Rickettsiales bacterium]
MQSKEAPKKSWLRKTVKITLWFLLLIILTLAIAYWTAPSWVPGQVSKFLPSNIKLQNLEFKRPGLTSTEIANLSLQLTIDQQNSNSYKVTLKRVKLGYSLWQRQLTSISAESAQLQLPESSSKTSPESPLGKSIPLPVLPAPKISIKQLRIDGLTLQPIVAKNVSIKDSNTRLSLNSKVLFDDKEFDIVANANRTEQFLQSFTADIKQQQNHLTLQASPETAQQWDFGLKGNIQINDFYAQPGIKPIKLELNGAINTKDSISLTLLKDSSLSSDIDTQQLGLIPKLSELLDAQHISTNLAQHSPNYHFALAPSGIVSINYNPQTNLLSLKQGQLDLELSNPTVKASASVSDLQLDLEQTLTHKAQQAELSVALSIEGVSAQLDSPEHKAQTDSISLTLSTQASLKNASLEISAAETSAKLGPVSYQGNNSTATISASDWTLKGSSLLHFSEQKQNSHNWTLDLTKALNGSLQLENEKITAKGLGAQLQFAQNTNNPKGLLSGSYIASDLKLKQQPLSLSGIKGNLHYALNQLPKGHLTFAKASYQGQQVGISEISGELDWRKHNNRFTAQGSLNHQQSKVPFTYEFNLVNSKHNLKVKQSSLPISTISSWLTILKDYPQLRFNSGQLEIDSLDGDPIGLLFDGQLKLDNFNLNYDEFTVENWTIEDLLTTSSQLAGTLKSHIERIQLATDIAITDISFLMPHTINSLVITNLKGNILSGSIEIPKLAINEQGIPPFTAYLKAIDTNALLQALNSEKLSLTGRFDFTLPLSISEQGQQITNGQFRALGEGTVKLKSEKGKEANIAFQALENFHYKEFSGTINYDLEGDYVVELHVLGSNPDLYNGFPIKLDLTLRGKLPKLLYSMIVSGDMTKPILDDLEQQQIFNIQ